MDSITYCLDVIMKRKKFLEAKGVHMAFSKMDLLPMLV